MNIKQGKQYWLVTISESDFMLNFGLVEVVRYKAGDRFAVVTQLCPDGTIWSKQLLTVSCSNLFTDLKTGLRYMRGTVATLLHNIDDFLDNRIIGKNGVMGELHVPANTTL